MIDYGEMRRNLCWGIVDALGASVEAVKDLGEAFERGRQRAHRPEGLVGRVAISAETGERLGVIRRHESYVSPVPDLHQGEPPSVWIERPDGTLAHAYVFEIRLAPLDEEAGDA